MSEQLDIFISYSRRDSRVARALGEALMRRGLSVWIDVDSLSVGQNWANEISRGLRSARAIVSLFSASSLTSEWVIAEFEHARRLGLRVIPVLLGLGFDDLPIPARTVQALILPLDPSAGDLDKAADDIAGSLGGSVEAKIDAPTISVSELAPLVEAEIAKVVRPATSAEAPDSVFLVHGHADDARSEVAVYLESLGVRPVVLKEVAGADQSLLQRFLRVGSEAEFAVVILSADDIGAARRQYEADGVGERALQFRARQNVILELGFFYGYLGWDHVFGLLLDPDRVFPNFERPSDLDGVVYERIDSSNRWKLELRTRLEQAGFVLKTLPAN